MQPAIDKVINQSDRPTMTSKEAADYIDHDEATLRTWRCTGKVKIPFYKVGSKVRYKKSDLDAWLESRRVAA